MRQMASAKRSVTIDEDVLAELEAQEGAGFNLSALVNDALRARVKRLNALALLDELERTHPISPEDRAAGEALWRRTHSRTSSPSDGRAVSTGGRAEP